jgi:hypothetical protein
MATTTKKDVDQSNSGREPLLDGGVQSGAEISDAPKVDYTILKLKKSRRGRVHIDGVDDVFNPETKKRERIRLLNGVAEIWVSKQKDLDKDFVAKNRRSLVFEKTICRIPSWDTAAQEFWKVCNSNIENKHRIAGTRHEFYEYNPAKAQAELLAKRTLGLKMAIMVNEMEENKVRELASYFAISFVDDLGQPKVIDGIRTELMLIANANPEQFQAKVDSEEVRIQYQIRKAILNAKIDIGSKPGEAHLATGGFICKIPLGDKPLAYLTALAMSHTDEGQKFKEKLKTL